MTRRLVAAGLFALGVLFLFFPILIVAPMSFSADRFLGFPPASWGLTWYRAYFTDPVWLAATGRSLRIALLASLIATTAGTAAVVGLGRVRPRPRAALTGLFLAPAIIPNIIIALGVFILALRIGGTDSEITLVFAHATLGLPFVVMIVGAAYRQTDPALERAARVFGAGPLRAFWTATLPAILPAILAAAIFAFFVSFDELVVALFLMGGAETLPVRIWNDLRFEINPTIAAISTLFVIVTAAAMALAEFLRLRATRRQGSP
ncbi:ABC transporter permease [Aquibium sp. A9E412]|uniref:ABC transporter permease n=1 Tax=Aquibium sp. A9E412 TaxID=2976767 RepID=UPI0025B14C60|nr:ABC transporter permease [Aquibium sp. A9E412]MDN2567630.1 ABC transporter permease [Aquibium sp. A9E412]